MNKEFKEILFKVLDSHSRLAQWLYDADDNYNNTDLSHVVETQAIEFLSEHNLLDEFLEWSGDD